MVIIVETGLSMVTAIKNKLRNPLNILSLLTLRISFTKSVEPNINKLMPANYSLWIYKHLRICYNANNFFFFLENLF